MSTYVRCECPAYCAAKLRGHDIVHRRTFEDHEALRLSSLEFSNITVSELHGETVSVDSSSAMNRHIEDNNQHPTLWRKEP
ncbi:hypothetical protein CU097_004312 [Rhizopus azygosporus]|uniref:Uncharacterized protein n=1 Tax=Rhizopus azygosporus TaxID=86630 RepID=A0A367IXB8_RHIAZ|nr:hypothetical protein CU097_004312 [Rhizopus azygosporus]